METLAGGKSEVLGREKPGSRSMCRECVRPREGVVEAVDRVSQRTPGSAGKLQHQALAETAEGQAGAAVSSRSSSRV